MNKNIAVCIITEKVTMSNKNHADIHLIKILNI